MERSIGQQRTLTATEQCHAEAKYFDCQGANALLVNLQTCSMYCDKKIFNKSISNSGIFCLRKSESILQKSYLCKVK